MGTITAQVQLTEAELKLLQTLVIGLAELILLDFDIADLGEVS